MLRGRGFRWLDQKFRRRPGSNSDRLLDSTRRGFIKNLFWCFWPVSVPSGWPPPPSPHWSHLFRRRWALKALLAIYVRQTNRFYKLPSAPLKKTNILARLRPDWLRRFRVAQRLARGLCRKGGRALGLDNSLEEGGISPSKGIEGDFSTWESERWRTCSLRRLNWRTRGWAGEGGVRTHTCWTRVDSAFCLSKCFLALSVGSFWAEWSLFNLMHYI